RSLTRRRYSAAESPASSRTLSHSIVPPLIVSSPLRQRSNVDFPLPEAPMTPSTVCGGTSKLIPLRISLSPKRLHRSVTRIMRLPPQPRVPSPDLSSASQEGAQGGPSGDSSRGKTPILRYRATKIVLRRWRVHDKRWPTPKLKSQTQLTCL